MRDGLATLASQFLPATDSIGFVEDTTIGHAYWSASRGVGASPGALADKSVFYACLDSRRYCALTECWR